MRLRSLSALVLMTASASASAIDAIPLLSIVTGPSIPGIGALPLGALPAGLLGGAGGIPALPGVGSLSGFNGRLPAFPAVSLPGLLPLPALPIPVTQIALGLGGYDMLFGTLEGLAPFASQLPVPAVATMFSNYGH